MGESRDGCNGTRHSSVEYFCMESEAYKICEEWAMQLFQQVPQEGMSPNKFTSVQVIKACAVLGALEEGRLVHEQLIQSGCESDVFLGSSLVDIEDAWRVFNKMPS